MEKLTCSHCGARDFEELPSNRVRCRYCAALYERKGAPPAPAHSAFHLVIGKNAHVVIGEKAHVLLPRDAQVEIEDGAQLEVFGQLELVEPGDPARKAPQR